MPAIDDRRIPPRMVKRADQLSPCRLRGASVHIGWISFAIWRRTRQRTWFDANRNDLRGRRSCNRCASLVAALSFAFEVGRDAAARRPEDGRCSVSTATFVSRRTRAPTRRMLRRRADARRHEKRAGPALPAHRSRPARSSLHRASTCPSPAATRRVACRCDRREPCDDGRIVETTLARKHAGRSSREERAGALAQGITTRTTVGPRWRMRLKPEILRCEPRPCCWTRCDGPALVDDIVAFARAGRPPAARIRLVGTGQGATHPVSARRVASRTTWLRRKDHPRMLTARFRGSSSSSSRSRSR